MPERQNLSLLLSQNFTHFTWHSGAGASLTSAVCALHAQPEHKVILWPIQLTLDTLDLADLFLKIHVAFYLRFKPRHTLRSDEFWNSAEQDLKGPGWHQGRWRWTLLCSDDQRLDKSLIQSSDRRNLVQKPTIIQPFTSQLSVLQVPWSKKLS